MSIHRWGPSLSFCAAALLVVTLAVPQSQTASAQPVTAGPQPTTGNSPAWQESGRLGNLEFPNSGSERAQEPFLRGVLLLHSFQYEDSAEAFREAQQIDPGFAMAYWGEAMTYNHPIWMQQDRDQAMAVLQRLGATWEERLAKSSSRREKAYLRALAVLYGDDGDDGDDKLARDLAYSQAMEQLWKSEPDDHEAAAFYALSLLGTCHQGRDFKIYMKAAAVVDRVFAANPRHPGAAHYLIHSYDDPIHGPLGLRAATAYSDIAPAAPHALHMPSHIFFALGMWEEAARMNERSWEAADERRIRKQLSLDARNYHALLWMQYAYLQQGRYKDAFTLLQTVENDAAATDSERIHGVLASMRSVYLVESRQWDAVRFDAAAVDAGTSASARFAQGLAALRRGDSAGAKASLAAWKRQQAETARESSSMPGYSDRAATAKIMLDELMAAVRFAEGQTSVAEELVAAAAAAEDRLPLEFGPPVPVKPAHELFGDILLQMGRHDEAQAQFRQALSRAPKRALSLLGLGRAAERAGKSQVAERAYSELQRMWLRADADLPELAEVNRYLAGAVERR